VVALHSGFVSPHRNVEEMLKNGQVVVEEAELVADGR